MSHKAAVAVTVRIAPPGSPPELLLGWPPTRLPFRAADAPDVTLLAFGVADVLLFVGTSAASGYGFATNRRWGEVDPSAKHEERVRGGFKKPG